MDEIRHIARVGYATIEEELEIGLISIAVPVYNRRAEVVAALSTSSTTARRSMIAFKQAALPVMQRAAEDITCILP